MQIQYQLEIADIIALQENVVETSYTHKIKSEYFQWIVTIALLIAGVVFWKMNTTISMILVLIAFVFMFLGSTFYKKLAQATSRRKILKQDYTTLLQPCTMEISEEGISRLLDDKKTFFAWDKFSRVSEDMEHYFLYADDLQGLIIPKKPRKIKNMDTLQYQERMEKYISKIGK